MTRLLVVCAALVLLAAFGGMAGAGTIVRFDTSLGSFDVQLYDTDTPVTVQNFLNYVRDGDYVDSFFHRLVPGFVLQGGGFIYKIESNTFYFVPSDPPIVNEFMHSNLRGTIAMAKLAGDPNSATSQFFINLADNSATLDWQNGGFTVFGHVMDGGMEVVDRLAGVPPNPYNVAVWNASGFYPAFGELPLIDYINDGRAFGPYLKMVHSIAVLLAWEGPTGQWDDPYWYDGSQHRSPIGGEAMVIASGWIGVDTPIVGQDTAASLAIEGGTLDISASGQLAVAGSVSVAEPATLLVDGQLTVARTVDSLGTLGGSGTISANRVTISGILSPGRPAGAASKGQEISGSAMAEPSSLMMWGMIVLGAALTSCLRRTTRR